MRPRPRPILILLSLLIMTAPAVPATLNVDCNGGGDYITIKEGIAAAAPGDLVLVAPGCYVENIDLIGKSIHVASHYVIEEDSSFISSTVVDGRLGNYPNDASTVKMISGEGSQSILEGFTIRGGRGHEDGRGYYSGGGIYIMGSSPTIKNNIITENAVINSHGSGGGIACDAGSNPLIDACLIIENEVDEDGGGIHIYGDSSPVVNGCRIIGNRGDRRGGGVFVDSSLPIIVNNIIAKNTSDYGGGIYMRNGSDGMLLNNTLVENAAISSGGGIRCHQSSSPAIVNNIICSSINGKGITYKSDCQPVLSHNDLWNNNGGNYGDSAAPGEGDISADPMFVPGDTLYYHLTASSPCVDSGAESAVVLDIDGQPRPWFGGYDIGADEYCPNQPPEPFDLVSPADQTIFYDTPIDFDWDDTTDPDRGDSFTYSLVYSQDPLFETYYHIDGLTESNYTLHEELENYSLYYWKVKAVDTHEEVTWSRQTWTIQTFYAEPDIHVTPLFIDLLVYHDTTVKETISLTNLGDLNCTFSLSKSKEWVEISPLEGEIPPGFTIKVEVEICSDGLTDGQYSDTIVIVSNDPDQGYIEVLVTIEVVSPFSCSITPVNPTVPRGGRLKFTVVITNDTDEYKEFNLWMDLTLPDGTLYNKNPLVEPLTFALGPWSEIESGGGLRVHPKAPLGGPYTLTMKIGEYPIVVYCQDSFDFYVTVKE